MMGTTTEFILTPDEQQQFDAKGLRGSIGGKDMTFSWPSIDRATDTADAIVIQRRSFTKTQLAVPKRSLIDAAAFWQRLDDHLTAKGRLIRRPGTHTIYNTRFVAERAGAYNRWYTRFFAPFLLVQSFVSFQLATAASNSHSTEMLRLAPFDWTFAIAEAIIGVGMIVAWIIAAVRKTPKPGMAA